MVSAGGAVRSWRIQSATPLAEVQLAEPLGNRLVSCFASTPTTDDEFEVLVLDDTGVSERLSLASRATGRRPPPSPGFRLVGSSLYQLGSTPARRLFVDRYRPGGELMIRRGGLPRAAFASPSWSRRRSGGCDRSLGLPHAGSSANNCNYNAPQPTSYFTATARSTVALYARYEGYQWGGGCWNDNDVDDSPGDPTEDPNTGGEGGDCSGFTFKVWRESPHETNQGA